jgi:hypothetical protein
VPTRGEEMTKKNYIAIAEVIRKQRNRVHVFAASDHDVNVAMNAMEDSLVELFKADNPRFDEDKFRQASKGNLREVI